MFLEAPKQENEKDRLKALYAYEVLDSEAEERFDEIVKLASEICETPIALISLIDEKRQWFKAKVGITSSETPRSEAFCAHAILNNEPMIIPDATQDNRFADNPLVQSGLKIRFYGGVPLVNPQGFNIGTLCVIDNKERLLDQRQILTIKVLAKQVIAQLEFRSQMQRQKLLNEKLEGLNDELAHQQTLLSVFVENAPAAIAMFDRDMHYVASSKAWSSDYGLDKQELTGRSHYEVFPNINETWKEIHRRALAGETLQKDRDRWRPPNWDCEQILRWEIRPWYTKTGDTGGIIMLTQDITKQCQREDELEKMRSVAEAATYAKSQFLANMSHEIRTPLTSIIGFAEAAREDGVVSEDRVQAFDKIFNNGKHLLGVINDILDLSKIDAGALKMELLPCSPVALVENLRTLLVPRVAEKELSLLIDYQWELPKTICTDALRLMQVLVNLASNAIKFTQSGNVEISVSCNRLEQRLHFSIRDTGIGLSREQMSLLFKPFSQAEDGTTRRYGGTGLGLSISKQLVERLGGEIAVESAPQKGSTFFFSIETGPLDEVDWISTIPQEQNEPQATKKSNLQLRGKILIADDAKDNRILIKFTLRNSGLELKSVENGRDAVQAALTEHFDLILLDMQMPVMDGYTAARQLRLAGIKVPIVAFTANAMKQDILNCIEAGCTAHLPKPFGKHALMECLQEQLLAADLIAKAQKSAFSELIESDPEATPLILDFVAGLSGRILKITRALERMDFTTVEAEAHKLSASAGLFGFRDFSNLVSHLEGSAKEKQLDQCKRLTYQIQNSCLEIVEQSRSYEATQELP